MNIINNGLIGVSLTFKESLALKSIIKVLIRRGLIQSFHHKDGKLADQALHKILLEVEQKTWHHR